MAAPVQLIQTQVFQLTFPVELFDLWAKAFSFLFFFMKEKDFH